MEVLDIKYPEAIAFGGDGTKPIDEVVAAKLNIKPKEQPADGKKPDAPVAPVSIDTPLITVTPTTDDDLTDDNKLFSFITQKYGEEVKSRSDIVKVLQKIDALQGEKELLSKEALKAKELENVIMNMPDELALPFQDWVNGKDYKQTITNIIRAEIDYSKPVESYDKDQLILRYSPDFKKEDLDDMDERAKTALYIMAKDKYNTEKNSHLTFIDNKRKEAVLINKEREQSVNDAITALKKKYPGIKGDTIDNVRKKLIEGYSFTDGHKYREDAAIKIALAEYAPQTIDSLTQQIYKQAQADVSRMASQEREFIASKLNTTPPAQPAGDGRLTIEEIAKKETAYLRSDSKLKNREQR